MQLWLVEEVHTSRRWGSRSEFLLIVAPTETKAREKYGMEDHIGVTLNLVKIDMSWLEEHGWNFACSNQRGILFPKAREHEAKDASI